MKISVIGIGYVGLVASCAFAHSGYEVLGVEKDVKRLELLKRGICPVYEDGLGELLSQCMQRGLLVFTDNFSQVMNSDIVFITVGTPSMPSGQADLSQVYEAVNQVVDIMDSPTILVMKSTVPPGTGEIIKKRFIKSLVRISYVSNPEFLREGKALWDWYHPDRIVIGGENEKSLRMVAELFSNIKAPIVTMDITSAEMVKYASNAFLATKISFINEIANLCDLVGANIDNVAQAVGMDKRIGENYLQAGLGYGGSCFPKDTKGLNYISTFKGYNFNLLKAVIEVNYNQRVNAVRKISEALGDLNDKKIAVLGLSFKAGTDDVRESPSLDIITLLLSEGARVSAFDPLATKKSKIFLPPDVKLFDDIYKCLENANAILLATEWPEFKSLDWVEIKVIMQPPYIIMDGRNMLNKEKLNNIGLKYLGVGR